MTDRPETVVDLVRAGGLDAELAALLWLLADGGVPVHVASGGSNTTATTDALRVLASDPGAVSHGPGDSIEAVLRQPVPLRPATGAVLILDDAGRVVAAHLHRPPLRDAAGHIRPQGPAVLATWNASLGAWEHFAWGVTPELAAAAGHRAGDFEIELDRRQAFLQALADAGRAPEIVAAAIAAYEAPSPAQ